MTHWSLIASAEGDVPYVLAAIDRKSVNWSDAGGIRRTVGFELAKKFAVVPEKKLIILGRGMRSACDAAMNEIVVRAHERASMFDLARAGGNSLSELMLTRCPQTSAALADNQAATIAAVGMHDGAGVLAHVDAEYSSGKVHLKRLTAHGNFYISSVHVTRVEDIYNRFSGHVPMAEALEAIALSQEEAAAKYPEYVSKEFDVLLLTPGGKPMELQVDYEWGRPVVKRARPITRTFVPWEAGNRMGFTET